MTGRHSLYCDGGVIGPNPSADGGTFAWVRVAGYREVARGTGVILPLEVGGDVVTNNQSELIALIQGIACLPDDWAGEVCSDSKNALGWWFWQHKVNNVPPLLIERLKNTQREAAARGLKLFPVLLSGHPSKDELKKGRESENPSLPVSKFNVRCDNICKKQARLHRQKLWIEAGKEGMERNG